MTEKELRLQIWVALSNLLGDRMLTRNVTPEARERLDQAVDGLVETFKAHNFRFTDSVMQVQHFPAITVQESATVKFSESDFPHLITSIDRDDKLAPAVLEWLSDQHVNPEVEFDRGDWGEGTARVTLTFSYLGHAQAFVQAFGLEKDQSKK